MIRKLTSKSCPSQCCMKRKNQIFIFTSLCASEGLMKALKAPQRSVKIRIYLKFYFNTTFRNAHDGKG